MRNLVLLVVLAAAVSGCSILDESAARQQSNPAPCPNVFVLKDASRFIDFGEAEPALETVAYSGEITDVQTTCRYFDDRPIDAEVAVDFSIGRGPAGAEERYEVPFFVAVTRTNRDVIAKETFVLPVRFQSGTNVVNLSREINKIVIPRLGEKTSGVNFEIAIGFALTREQVIYNRSGRSLRFPEA